MPSKWLRVIRSRDFARDIVVTTLGVLLALFIGELAENLRWYFKVERTEAALHDEASRNFGVMYERELTTPCIERRLSEVAEIIEAAQQNGRFPTIENIGRPVTRPIFDSVWTIAQNEGSLLRMSLQDTTDYRVLYDVFGAHRANQDPEGSAWATLELVSGKARDYPQEITAILYQALSEARYRGRMSLAYVRDASRIARRMNISLRVPSGRPMDIPLVKKVAANRPICKPLIVDGEPYQMKGPVLAFAAELPGPIMGAPTT